MSIVTERTHIVMIKEQLIGHLLLLLLLLYCASANYYGKRYYDGEYSCIYNLAVLIATGLEHFVFTKDKDDLF